MEQKYAEYAAQKAVELLAIDSPTGFTDRAAAWVQDAFGALGFAAKKTAKGGEIFKPPKLSAMNRKMSGIGGGRAAAAGAYGYARRDGRGGQG